VNGPMIRIDFVWPRYCPDVAEWREKMREGLLHRGLLPIWQEWDEGDSRIPSYIAKAEGPGLFMNGTAIWKIPEGSASSKMPDSEQINQWLAAHEHEDNRALARRPWHWRLRAGLSLLSPFAVFFLPKCALCVQAYFTLFGAFGLEAFVPPPLGTWLMLGLLLANVILFAVGANKSKGKGPLVAAIAASAAIAVGDWLDLHAAVLWGGLLLFAAAWWNVLPGLRPLPFAWKPNRQSE
jgi:hypothetical protein